MLSLALIAGQAYAADTAFDSTFCNVSHLVTGTPGKLVAATALVSAGVGFFVGKISWGMLIAVTIGVGTMTGAPTIVSAITGDTLQECRQGSLYTITTDGNNFFSCPIGYTGQNCDTCATGFSGPDCSVCDVGYMGAQCNECDIANGYNRYNGVCYQSCTVSGIIGISPTTVVPGSNSMSCNANSNVSGSISYVCDARFTYSGSCSCVGNYDITSSCTACLSGYDINSGCSSCINGYTNVNGSCQKNCTTSGITGISNGVNLLPPAGSVSCENSLGFDGLIDYSCSSGFLSIIGSCSDQRSMCFFKGEGTDLLTMTAPTGKVWKTVVFASYGQSNDCGSFVSCHAGNSASIVEGLCLNSSSCTVQPHNSVFGDPCPGQPKRLRVMMMWGDP